MALGSGPWFVFPCRCPHGCGPFYSLAQVFATPCQGGHHAFSFPRAPAPLVPL